MEKIKGLIDAPFTPFDRNGDVNCEPIRPMLPCCIRTA